MEWLLRVATAASLLSAGAVVALEATAPEAAPAQTLTEINELATARHDIEALRAEVHALQHALAKIQAELGDARQLAIIGGPKRRYVAGVTCTDRFLPGSNGEAAQRALRAGGWCD